MSDCFGRDTAVRFYFMESPRKPGEGYSAREGKKPQGYIAIELIDAASDAYVWSESYPGDLSDLSTIFARAPTTSAEADKYYLAAPDAARAFTLEGTE